MSYGRARSQSKNIFLPYPYPSHLNLHRQSSRVESVHWVRKARGEMDGRSVLQHPGAGTLCSPSSFLARRAMTPFFVSSITSSLTLSAKLKLSSEDCRSCHGFVSSHQRLGRKQGMNFVNTGRGLGFGDGALGIINWRNGRTTKTKSGERRFATARGAAATAALDQKAAAAEEFSAWLKDQGFPEQVGQWTNAIIFYRLKGSIMRHSSRIVHSEGGKGKPYSDL